MVYTARQLQEKCQEENSTYVDLIKAFDTVSRESLSESVRSIDAQQNSSLSFDSCMMGCRQESKMVANPKHYPIERSRAWSSPRRSSALCSPPCWLMPTMAWTTESASNGALIVQSSTSDGFNQRPRFIRTPSTTSYCWWCCHRRYLWGKYSAKCWLVLWCLRQLKPYYQHKENRSHALVSTRKIVRWAQHYHNQPTDKCSRQGHVPRYHSLHERCNQSLGERQTGQDDSCFRQTVQERLGQKKHQSRDKDWGLPCCGSHHSCMLWSMDCLPKARKKVKPLLH